MDSVSLTLVYYHSGDHICLLNQHIPNGFHRQDRGIVLHPSDFHNDTPTLAPNHINTLTQSKPFGLVLLALFKQELVVWLSLNLT